MSTSVCIVAGCPALATGTRCDAHRREQQRQADAQRPSAARRGYGHHHQDFRARVLAEEPHCRHCGRPSEHADHINGDSTDTRRTNGQGLCHPCHSHKTSTQDQRRDEQGRWTKNEGEHKPSQKRRSGSAGSVPLG